MPHAPSKRPKPVDLVRASKKFLKWKPAKPNLPDWLEQSNIMKEQHYAPADLAKMWGVSVQTIR